MGDQNQNKMNNSNVAYQSYNKNFENAQFLSTPLVSPNIVSSVPNVINGNLNTETQSIISNNAFNDTVNSNEGNYVTRCVEDASEELETIDVFGSPQSGDVTSAKVEANVRHVVASPTSVGIAPQQRVTFKKSHTCGSLFAKCHCDDNAESTRRQSMLQSLLWNSDTTCYGPHGRNDALHAPLHAHTGAATRKLSTDDPPPVDKEYDLSGRSNSLDSPAAQPLLPRKNIQRPHSTHSNTPTSTDPSKPPKTDAKKDSTSSCRQRKVDSVDSPKTSETEERITFPTLENIYSARICLDHPELCLKHPEFPYPIPPKNLQAKNLSHRTSDTTSVKSDTTSDASSLSDKPRKASKSDQPPQSSSKPIDVTTTTTAPLSLTQIFESRDYVPDFHETLPRIHHKDENSHINLEYLRYNTLVYGKQYNASEDAETYFKESGIFGPMGNGVSTSVRKNSKILSQDNISVNTIRKNSKILIDTVKKRSSCISEDYEYLKTIVPHLKKEADEWEDKAKRWELQLIQLQKTIQLREQENLKLQREVHKLKSVLQQATSFAQDGDLLAHLQEKHGMANRLYTLQSTNGSPAHSGVPTALKKQGVSAESSDSCRQQASDIQIVRHEKDFRSKQLIKDAIMDNDFLKNLDSSQVRELVDSMYQREFSAGSYVIREGEAGAHLFVSANGEFEVIKDNIVLGKMGPGKAFGELAVLYNCTRTASIRVVVDSKVWVLDRRVFQQIMMRTGLQRLQDNINFLRSVPLLRNLNTDVLAKIADVLEVEFYPADAYIIRQGASGDTFFIISGGTVKVTQTHAGRSEEEVIRSLQRGDYFGEQALLKEDCRTASIVAQHPGVECLTLDRDSFIQLIGDLSELQEKDYGDDQRVISRPNSSVSVSTDSGQDLDYIHLDDLDVIATLGVGGFGRVELVQYAFDRTQTYALKCLKKQHIIETHQQEHVHSEKTIMMSCRSPFICRLYKTFKDNKYVYMLLEACLGGEVWTILRDRSCFDDHTTRFITACVIEAFEYLHSKGIVYRDLKPENLILDARGYVKLVDFGFSKRIGLGTKTWTFCGTPEYVAPETILNKGHDRAVDYWALGVLMHELLTGIPPFTAADPMKTYNIILKGIDMIDFPRHITRAAQSLIKRLCRDSPSERLGYQRGGIQDIKKHKWFQGFDWDGLHNRTMTPPIVQVVRGPSDTSNFECYAKDKDIPPDELSNWDAEF